MSDREKGRVDPKRPNPTEPSTKAATSTYLDRMVEARQLETAQLEEFRQKLQSLVSQLDPEKQPDLALSVLRLTGQFHDLEIDALRNRLEVLESVVLALTDQVAEMKERNG